MMDILLVSNDFCDKSLPINDEFKKSMTLFLTRSIPVPNSDVGMRERNVVSIKETVQTSTNTVMSSAMQDTMPAESIIRLLWKEETSVSFLFLKLKLKCQIIHFRKYFKITLRKCVTVLILCYSADSPLNYR